MKRHSIRLFALILVAIAWIVAVRDLPTHADPLQDRLKSLPPKSPDEALKTFKVQDGFRMELVAHEPQVTSPVAAAYDEDARLFVVEMRDYPHPLKAGEKPIGRVRLLEDKDDNGIYESATVYADGLAWPTSVCCWDGGVFVTAAPDIWYFKDTNGDGVADVRKKVFSGFVVYNVQALVNGLQWGVDNRIYCVTAGNGGEVARNDKPGAKPVSVRGRDFWFDPRTLEFEAISGTAQFGNAFDDWYNRFVCANRLIAGHVVLPSHAIARNPALSVSRVVQDCAAEGENVPIPMFQISDAEPWRTVRTERYHAEGQKLPQSEMVAKGVFTSGTGITIYRGSAYPEKYRGQAFLGNPAGNLVHRRALTAKGSTFVATRIDKDCEFIASTDNWFRPVNFVNAPDGTLHVLDMYREVVEHPWSIPDDMKAHLDLSSGRDRGRIYRIAPPDFKRPATPRLSKATTAELVKLLEHPNAWHRETAQRLLYQRQDKDAVPLLRAIARESATPQAAMHALWALEGSGILEERDIREAMESTSPGLREQALRLAEPRVAKSPKLAETAIELAADADARVRFQAAITLGEVSNLDSTAALAALLLRSATDPYARTAVLSSCRDRELAVYGMLPALRGLDSDGWVATMNLLAMTIGSRGRPEELKGLLKMIAVSEASERERLATIQGLADGLVRGGKTLQSVKVEPATPQAAILAKVLGSAIAVAMQDDASVAARTRAAAMLVHIPFAESKAAFEKLLASDRSDLQLAAIRSLRMTTADEVPGLILKYWKGYTPAIRGEAINVLTSRSAWSSALLDAIANKVILLADLSTITKTLLVNHRDAKVRERAVALMGKATTTARAEVLANYKPALDKKGDATRGLAIFKRECASCHFAGGVGTSIGPAIAAIGTRTPDALLTAILDPNREVDPRYLNYTLFTTDERTLSGIITAETATSVTLRRADGVDIVMRSRIEELRSSGVSLMPEGVEKNITIAEMGDLLAFLATVK